MFLRSVKVKNFRSFWSDEPTELELSRSVNYIAGANNCGKSNLLRALAFGLDPKGYPHRPEDDRPRQRRRDVQPIVTLEFGVDGKPHGPVKTLLKYLDEYERSVQGFTGQTNAERGTVVFRVQGGASQRQELFLAAGRGSLKGDAKLLERALNQLRSVVRFVDIRSGEDLQSLLRRGFKQILGTVVAEDFTKEMEHARKCRDEYLRALENVLRPLAAHVQQRIGRYVQGINAVTLSPDVPRVDDAIAGAQFLLSDSVQTGLEQKGTGVRGATLLLLLSFIADSSRRAVVFAIEEPESFLHPEAHRELGVGLEHFASRKDVTVLVTTHSPFIFQGDDEDSGSRVFSVAKDSEGRSTVGVDRRKAVRADLLGSRMLAEYLNRADQVRDDTSLVIVVEGRLDEIYIRLAAKALGVNLNDIAIVPSGGAIEAAFQAVALRGLVFADKVVCALFDDDEPGGRAQSLLLAHKGSKWRRGESVLSYNQFAGFNKSDNVPVEAEDMFPGEMIECFLGDVGRDRNYAGQKQRPTGGAWHYDLTAEGKVALAAWLDGNAPADCWRLWAKLLARLRELADGAQAEKAQPAV